MLTPLMCDLLLLGVLTLAAPFAVLRYRARVVLLVAFFATTFVLHYSLAQALAWYAGLVLSFVSAVGWAYRTRRLESARTENNV